MNLENNANSGTSLVPGQLWEVGEHHIEIVSLGKTLCQFRQLRNLRQKGVRVQIEPRGTVEKLLKQNKAKMIGSRKSLRAKSRG